MFKVKKTRRKRLLPTPQAFIIAFILFLASTLWGLWLINREVTPALMKIAQTQASQVASYAINYGIGKQTIKNMENNLKQNSTNSMNEKGQLIHVSYDKNHKITSVTYNTVEINKILVETTNRIQWFLRNVENGKISISDGNQEEITYTMAKGDGVIARIPLGQSLNNALLTNLGPSVPVKFQVISNVQTNVKRNIKEAGINNVYVQLYLHVQVAVRVVIPFALKTETISQDIPIAEQLIPGDVPYYYNGGSGSGGLTPTLPLPQSPLKTTK